MYVLSIPSKNVASHLEIKYMVGKKSINTIKKNNKKNNIVVGPMSKLITIMDDKKNIVTEKLNSFLFDISVYERYTKIPIIFLCLDKKK